ncbi:hypothetical protein DSECCO2_628210 [anaerobic digester metagenome]
MLVERCVELRRRLPEDLLDGRLRVALEVLRLVGDPHPGVHRPGIGFEHPGKEPGKRALADTVRPEDPEDLAAPDLPAVDGERELLETLCHRRELEQHLPVRVGGMGPGIERHRIRPEPDVLLREEPLQILVDPHPDTLRVGDDTEDRRFSVGDVHRIGKHIEDSKVVLDDHDRAFPGEFADQVCSGHPLVDVEVGRDLIQEVEVCIPREAGGDRHPLQLAAGEGRDRPVDDRPKREPVDVVIEFPALVGLREEVAHRPGEDLRDLIDVLRLYGDLHVLLREHLEVVEEFGPLVEVEDVLPGDRRIGPPQVRDERAREDLHRRALADTVGPQDTGDLPLDRDREAVEDEAVLAVAVGRLVELFGEVDDIESLKRTLLHADAAPDTELLGYDDLLVFADDDGLVAGPDTRTVDDALGAALYGVTPITVYNSNTHGESQNSGG